ncbi:MAG TPA: polysaccharide deacetylase family protein [Pirellulales bacterium]|jgi:peptidoglycan/xylan/chitin deacetylase (PgdA/CDA1 family)
MADPRIVSWATEHARLLLSRYRRDESSLLTFMFHALVDGSRISLVGPVHPSQCNTTEQFSSLVEFYLDLGYQFVGPSDILAGLNETKNHVLLTFDDGYFNNALALPVLEEFQVPAIFFISTANILRGKSYWPDVVYRRRTAGGASQQDIRQELSDLKKLTPLQIESRLCAEFGPEAMAPTGDADRPLQASELAALAKHPLVSLGNHTRDHTILTNVGMEEVRQQIAGAQDDLMRICQVRPNTIAYPNGNHSSTVMQAAAAEGMLLGFTVEKSKTALPLSNNTADLLSISRLHLRHDRPLRTQLEIFRGRFGQRTENHRLGRAA